MSERRHHPSVPRHRSCWHRGNGEFCARRPRKKGVRSLRAGKRSSLSARPGRFFLRAPGTGERDGKVVRVGPSKFPAVFFARSLSDETAFEKISWGKKGVCQKVGRVARQSPLKNFFCSFPWSNFLRSNAFPPHRSRSDESLRNGTTGMAGEQVARESPVKQLRDETVRKNFLVPKYWR